MAKLPPSTPDSYPLSEAFDHTIEVQVGSKPEVYSFHIHKGVLRFYSAYFLAALHPRSWTEEEKGVVMLETEETPIFEIFAYWIYSRRFCDPNQVETSSLGWTDLLKLWTFADRRVVSLLQNEAINLMRRKTVEEWTVPTENMEYLYSNTVPGSALRKYVIEVVGKTSGIDKHGKETLEKQWSKEAIVDLVSIIWKPKQLQWSKADLKIMDICQCTKKVLSARERCLESSLLLAA